ncbi:hypothetical protein [Dactylosporangium sp. CA-233914]|uniref:hypothetical protein n=1 Tax=Dactylosporangium sp. CA-233914 TaxID=3239934 RepID=UPI003D8A554D
MQPLQGGHDRRVDAEAADVVEAVGAGRAESVGVAAQQRDVADAAEVVDEQVPAGSTPPWCAAEAATAAYGSATSSTSASPARRAASTSSARRGGPQFAGCVSTALRIGVGGPRDAGGPGHDPGQHRGHEVLDATLAPASSTPLVDAEPWRLTRHGRRG